MSAVPDSVNRGIALPDSLKDVVVVDYAGGTIHVFKGQAGTPTFLSWQDRMKRSGFALKVVQVDMDQIALLREEGVGVGSNVSTDMQNQSYAIDLIKRAADYHASDLHFHVKGNYAEIFVRVKGKLRVLERSTADKASNLIRAIYQGLATVKDRSFAPREFQNAQLSGDNITSIGLTSIRAVRGPSYPQDDGGNFCVLRLQYSDGRGARRTQDLKQLEEPKKPDGVLRFDRMGYTDKQVAMLRDLARSPNGIILFTGPTGSGKTTALAELLKELARSRPGSRQVTIEDPVEIPLNWAIQLAVTNAASEEQTGDQFQTLLRHALRMDPDTILLGEIRGSGTAESAVHAALTGHLVLSTLHLTDPFMAFERIEMMSPEVLQKRAICDHKLVRAIVAQRIIPILCPHCSVPLSESELMRDDTHANMIGALKTWGDLEGVKTKGDGCTHCNGDGTTGNQAVAEILLTHPKLMAAFIHEGTEAARQLHRGSAYADKSLLGNAVDLVLAGNVDPRDVEEKVDVIVAKELEL